MPLSTLDALFIKTHLASSSPSLDHSIMLFSTFSRATAFFTLLAVVTASPLEKRDVWTPPVLNPNSNTVWVVGETATVTW